MVRTQSRIKAGYESLTEINKMVNTLTIPCQNIKSYMTRGNSFITNPSQMLIDTVEMCNMILDLGIPKNNEAYFKYLSELKKFE